MKTRDQALKYGLSFPDTYQDAPFHDDNWQLVRFKGNDKAFLWTYEKDGYVNLNVKTDPEKAYFWRGLHKSVIPGYHQNKDHWNTIILDGSIPDKDVKIMIAESYDLISDSPSKRIYEAVKKIPYGFVATYSQVAEIAGDRKMARAVGNALHKNPDPDNIPCFRVVNAKGGLSGEFAFGGPDAQAKLLRKEGIEVKDGKVDLVKYQWKNNIKIIFSDLDGTLLNSKKGISKKTKDAVIGCQKKGIVFVACTARPERAIKEFCDDIPFDAVISLNGARVRCNKKNIDNGMSFKTSHQIIKKLSKDKNKIIVLETGSGIFSDTIVPEWDIKKVTDLTKLDKEIKVFKILVIGKDNRFETVKRSEDLILFKDVKKDVTKAVDEDTYFSISENWICQIMAKNDTKWNAVKEVLDDYGFTKDEAMYFGDDNDDAESIKNIGLGIAMGNAIERVKEKAKLIIKSNDSDGVAEYLTDNILKVR